MRSRTRRAYNPIGSVHGGFAATLLDSACGTAVHTSLRPGEAYMSLEIKVNFLRVITAETGAVRVHGWVTKAGSKAAFAEADLRDSQGRVLATASSTCAVFPDVARGAMNAAAAVVPEGVREAR